MIVPLPAPHRVQKVFSFDFDGTLHHPADQPPVPFAFFERIREWRETHDAVWIINTGRDLPHLLDGLSESRFPFLPDWIVAREREIYRVTSSGGLMPDDDWNASCQRMIHALLEGASGYFHAIRDEILEHTGAEWIAMDGEPAGIISRTEEEMDWICERIKNFGPPPELGWQRNTIYLRFGHRDYQKGSSLGRIAKFHGLSANACFAIGDGHNDLEMLDPMYARWIGCPANAVPDVTAQVRLHGGWVATHEHGTGTIDAMDALLDSLPHTC